jgi:hypothetical protein
MFIGACLVSMNVSQSTGPLVSLKREQQGLYLQLETICFASLSYTLASKETCGYVLKAFLTVF